MHDGQSTRFGVNASRRRFLGSVVGITGAALVTQAPGGDAREATPANGEPVELLFVQVCESGTAEPVDGEDGLFTLRLVHGVRQTLYFSDRPERIAGVIDTASFMEELNAIASDPPNAALVFQSSDGAPLQLAAVELTEPALDEAGAVTYRARILDPVAEGGLTTDDASRFVEMLPSIFGRATLFIDGINHVIIVANMTGPDRAIGVWKFPPR